MPITKEKVLFAAALLVTVVVLLDLRLPRSEPVPDVPPEQEPRAYRVVGGAPVLAPEETFSSERDPFHLRDAWSESSPARLAVPPAADVPRAFPGGPARAPRGPADRLLLEREPQPPERGS